MCGFFHTVLCILNTYGYELFIVPVFEKVCFDEAPTVLHFLSAFYFGVFYTSWFLRGRMVFQKKLKNICHSLCECNMRLWRCYHGSNCKASIKQITKISLLIKCREYYCCYLHSVLPTILVWRTSRYACFRRSGLRFHIKFSLKPIKMYWNLLVEEGTVQWWWMVN